MKRGTVNSARAIVIAPLAPPRRPASGIFVVRTDPGRTKDALAVACRLASGLDLPLTLLALQVIPYPLRLENPPVSLAFIEHELSELASGMDAEVAVNILLCREAKEALKSALAPDSVVVIATGRKWWRFRHARLARLLSADGRRLLLVG